MLENNDAAYLASNLRCNRVVLLLGAGFSRDAKNFINDPLPLAAGCHLPRTLRQRFGCGRV
jgi:hypothetical protein